MKVFSKLVLFLAALPFATFVSCSDEEGEGGKAKISGIVYKIVDGGEIAKSGDDYSFVRDTVVASDVDVFLIYGGDQNNVYDDKTKTSHNGKFEFDYLREGDYSVYAYNDDDSYQMKSVHCGKKGTTDVENMYILEGKNSGKCGIVGEVEILYASVTEDYVPAVGTRVFLRKDGSLAMEDTRTDDNGNYYFSRLDPDTEYTVWVEYEQRKNGIVVASSATVKTGSAGEIVKSDLLKAKTY